MTTIESKSGKKPAKTGMFRVLIQIPMVSPLSRRISQCVFALQFFLLRWLAGYDLARHNCKSLAIHIESSKRIIPSTFTRLQVCFSINLPVNLKVLFLSSSWTSDGAAMLLEGVLFDILNLTF